MGRVKSMDEIVENLKKDLADCEYLLIGIGAEWRRERLGEDGRAYDSLYQLAGRKDYFIVTTVTDGAILKGPFESARIVAPCGNESWIQCSEACTKDIWERGELAGETCPHCGAPLVANTIAAKEYIEEGYLPQWEAYKAWLSHTLNHKLLILELGVDFRTPTVIRWPFEKTSFFNQKSHMYRVNKTFFQIAEDVKDRAEAVEADSVEFVLKCCR